MLTDLEIDVQILRWLVMSPFERESSRKRLEKLRKALPRKNLFPGIWGFSLVRTKELALEMASDHGEPVAADLVEMALIDALMAPKMMGWVHTCKHLMNALDDPNVQQNPDAVSILTSALTDIQGFVGEDKADSFFWCEKHKAAQEALSNQASQAAKQKNKLPREWVLSAWTSRPDRAQKKAAFSRQYALLVKKEFDLIVTPDTIARDWLPKAKK